jgi:hypothetical protein
LKDTVLTGQENNLPHHYIIDKDWYIHVVVLHKQTDLRYRLVDIDSICQTFKYRSKSYVKAFNFVEVQNIHPESKRNFHIKIL